MAVFPSALLLGMPLEQSLCVWCPFCGMLHMLAAVVVDRRFWIAPVLLCVTACAFPFVALPAVWVGLGTPGERPGRLPRRQPARGHEIA
jgi:hypothetical protein